MPFRTLGNDAQGKVHAQAYDLDYPFPNDYFDAPDGASHPVTFAETSVCTGVILVGYREPLTDHVVTCEQLVEVATRRRVPLALWSSGGEVLQASELYRP